MTTRPPVCGRTFRGESCPQIGDHFCRPRAEHVVAFFARVLVHTKGRWARQPFALADWQRDDIIAPLFGEVGWDPAARCYARRYRIGWLELARKNGKSELLAGVGLYMLLADGEEGAEVVGCAKDRDQARKVWDVAERMVKLSPTLSKRLRIMPSNRRIIHDATGSYYEILAADASGALGGTPHCILFDEVLSQRDHTLWDALRTGMGTRTQPLLLAATTAGNDSTSFAGREHAECARIVDDPSRAPHRFVYMRNLPDEADPWDESNWAVSNPALGDFLSIEALREEAIEARNDPSRENAFRQYRLNQWVQQATRWMPMDRYDACTGELALTPDWFGDRFDRRPAFCGLDLSARHDLTSWAVLLPPVGDDETAHLLWRAWIPEGMLRDLDRATSGHASMWARQDWLSVTDGDVIDYEKVYADITADAKRYRIREIAYDRWCGEPVRQALADKLGVEMVPVEQTYAGMTGCLTELMSLVLAGRVAHHGNPIAAWCFDNVAVRHAAGNPDLVKIEKPIRADEGKRIDAAVAAALAVGGWKIRGAKPRRRGTVVGF